MVRPADRMVMLEKGRVLEIGPRRHFKATRDADPKTFSCTDERLIHQFLNGHGQGPLTDAEGITEFENLIFGSV